MQFTARLKTILARSLLVAAGLVMITAMITPLHAQTLLLFAAASTKEAVEEALDLYNENNEPSAKAVFASSSTLARQIEQGAPADLFLSASPLWTDYLQDQGLLEPAQRHDLLLNRLALIRNSAWTARASSPDDLPSALGKERLALGNPSHVPAGLYAKEALTHLGLWQSLSNHLAPTQDVRRALALVERGETPFGIVYRSDAERSRSVEIDLIFPMESHSAIRYPLALIQKDRPEAQALFAFLQGEAATGIFRKWGFERAKTGSAQ